MVERLRYLEETSIASLMSCSQTKSPQPTITNTVKVMTGDGRLSSPKRQNWSFLDAQPIKLVPHRK